MEIKISLSQILMVSVSRALDLTGSNLGLRKKDTKRGI
jgi:hypothetical protein